MIRLPERFRELGFDAIELEPTITDDDGGAASDMCIITVENVAPKVDLGPNIVVMEGDLITLDADVAVTDPSQDTFTYHWQVFSDNRQSVQGGTGSQFSFPAW